MTLSKVWLWSQGCKRGNVKVWQRGTIRFLSWMSHCNSLYSTWKFAGNVCVSTENGVTNINWWLFQQTWTLFSNSFIKTESTAARSSLFRSLYLAVICLHLSQHCPPGALLVFSRHSVNSTPVVRLLLSNGCVPGAAPLWRATSMMAQGRGWATLPAVLGILRPVGCGLGMPAYRHIVLIVWMSVYFSLHCNLSSL